MEMATIEEKLPEIGNVNQTMCARALELAQHIHDRETLDAAVSHGKEIDRRLKWWEDFINPVVASAHGTWKALTERRETVASPLRRAKVSLSSAIGFYKNEMEKRRLAEEARLRVEAQRQAEDEQLNAAVALERAGQKPAAEAVLDAPVIPPPVVLPKQAETDGTHTRTNWKFCVTDEAKLPREYLIPDLKKIGMVVRAMKDKHNIPGVEAQEEKREVFR